MEIYENEITEAFVTVGDNRFYPGANLSSDKTVMGCDIHIGLVHLVECGKWDRVRSYDKFSRLKEGIFVCRDRNYLLFALLADVRNSDHLAPFSYPRGLPFDVTEEVKEMVGEDNHSLSYFTFEELFRSDWDHVYPKTGRTYREELKDYYGHFQSVLEQIGSHPSEARMVFGFDN